MGKKASSSCSNNQNGAKNVVKGMTTAKAKTIQIKDQNRRRFCSSSSNKEALDALLLLFLAIFNARPCSALVLGNITDCSDNHLFTTARHETIKRRRLALLVWGVGLIDGKDNVGSKGFVLMPND